MSTKEKIKELRGQGKTYNEISEILDIDKSTISFHLNDKYRENQMINQKARRKNYKDQFIIRMGGKCQICGYDKCSRALEFHHLDPTKKDPIFKKGGLHIHGPTKFSAELSKCILLCSNCHREVHAGVTKLESQTGNDPV